MENPSVAMLVLAYNEPNVLTSHMKHLEAEAFKFFVHVDRKRNLSDFQDVCLDSRVHFIEDREDIFWGGFNMIRATIKLAKEALTTTDAEHFCLVSDDSFPLLAAKSLYRRIVNSNDIIQCYAAKKADLQYKRYENYYHFDSVHASARHVQAEGRSITAGDLESYSKIQSLMLRGKRPALIYGGSQWWVLSRDSLIRCLDLFESDEWLAESFAFSAIPDEMLFQTLYCETQRRLNSTFEPRTQSSVYADFRRVPKPFVYDNIGDVNVAEIGKHLFLRKVSYVPDLLSYLPSVGN